MKMRCRLCGHQFDPAGLACHSSCPLGSRCELICCPNCGYQVVDESRSLLAKTLRKVLRTQEDEPEPRPRREIPSVPTVPLTHVREGASVEVRRLDGMTSSRLSRLTSFGLAPGTRITVVQRRPVPVVSVGETELALSEEIVSQIHVTPPGER